MTSSFNMTLSAAVQWDQPTLWVAVAVTAACPTFWNIVAQREHRTRFMTKAFGSPYRACYALAATIFAFSALRDYAISVAIDHQPTADALNSDLVKAASYALFALGNILVLSTYYRLGITGTYLGDYFGIFMDERITGFPFSLVDNPMYLGSTLIFLSMGLFRASPAGVLLAGVVYIVYQVAISFEGPFTTMIYQQRESSRKRK